MLYEFPILSYFKYPISLITNVILWAFWLFLFVRNVPVEKVAFIPKSFLEKKEYWRSFTSALSHYNILHLVMNTASAWSVKEYEIIVGKKIYLIDVLILIIVSDLIYVFIEMKILKRNGEELAVGYSGVLFGLQVLMALHNNYLNIYGLKIPWNF